FVNSASTGSSTVCPRCFASRIDQITSAAWWHETQLCSFLQAIASLARKAKPRSIVGSISNRLWSDSSAEATPQSVAATIGIQYRTLVAPGAPGSDIDIALIGLDRRHPVYRGDRSVPTISRGCCFLHYTRKLSQPTRDVERFAGDPGRLRRREENNGWRDVLRLTDSAKRGLRFGLLAEMALGDARVANALGFDHSGVD